jgi:hypothetical protein
MRGFYQEDIPAFAIEVHGMKGALLTIGADSLGEEAKALELAAKGGDATYCTEAYPPFEEKLALFAEKLAGITEKPAIAPRGTGSIPALAAGLRNAMEAIGQFHAAEAGKEIAALLEYTWEGAVSEARLPVSGELKKINDSIESIDYDDAKNLISSLLESLEAGKAGT